MLLTLSPTLRMEAIAATAIRDTIRVHSTAEAPLTSRANRRKSESMRGTPPSSFLFLWLRNVLNVESEVNWHAQTRAGTRKACQHALSVRYRALSPGTDLRATT